MSETTITGNRINQDVIRQVLNVVFAFAEVAVTAVGYLIGTNTAFTKIDSSTPPIVPAYSAFVIWAIIFTGAIAYALYQALPHNRENALLRRVGFYTASAFMGTTVWIIVAQMGLSWLTVVCFVWILISLLGAFFYFFNHQDTFNALENWLVVIPVSIYTGWTTVALIANIATALSGSGFNNVLLSNQNWTIVMLIIGSFIASFTTLRSRGNIAYALAVVWALVWILVANVERSPNAPIAITSGAAAVLVLLALLFGRTRGRSLFQDDLRGKNA